MAIDLLTIGFKDGKTLLAFGHALAAHLDDLQIGFIDPDASLKEPLAHFLGQDLWLHIEDIRIELVDVLGAQIVEVVLIDL